MTGTAHASVYERCIRLNDTTNLNFEQCLDTLHATNFEQCLHRVRTGQTKTQLETPGATDDDGKILDDPHNATGLMYGLCVKECGGGQEPFQWDVFSQQFSAWLLPWLALIRYVNSSLTVNLRLLVLTRTDFP